MKFTKILKAVKTGLETTDDFSVYIGDTNYDKASYPMAQLFPAGSNYEDNEEYRDTYTVYFVFEKSNARSNEVRERKFLDRIDSVENAVDLVQNELRDCSVAKEFKPVNFDFLVGENSGNMLDVVQVDWEVTKIQDLCFNN